MYSVLLLFASGCDDTKAPTPTAPSNPTPNNQAPQITRATVAPSFAIAGFTTITAHVEARDPDGDPLTYAWELPGPNGWQPIGNTADVSFTCRPTSVPLKITVTDSKGATTTTSIPVTQVIVADLNGTYVVRLDGGDPRDNVFRMTLARAGSTITGTVSDYKGHTGRIDPAAPGTLAADGQFRLRIKLQDQDFVLAGHLEPDVPERFSATDYRGVGRVIGGAWDGLTFAFGLEDRY